MSVIRVDARLANVMIADHPTGFEPPTGMQAQCRGASQVGRGSLERDSFSSYSGPTVATINSCVCVCVCVYRSVRVTWKGYVCVCVCDWDMDI